MVFLMKCLCGTKRNAVITWLESFYLEPNNGERLFLSVFLVHVIFMCLQTTMFKFPGIVFTIEKYLALLLIVLKIIVFDKYDNKMLLFGAVLLVDAFLVAGISTYQDVLIFSIVLLGCKGVDFVKILKVYFVGNIAVLLAAFVASRLDIIEDLVYIRDYVVERNSFGTIYPTDFAAHIFFLFFSVMCVLLSYQRFNSKKTSGNRHTCFSNSLCFLRYTIGFYHNVVPGCRNRFSQI